MSQFVDHHGNIVRDGECVYSEGDPAKAAIAVEVDGDVIQIGMHDQYRYNPKGFFMSRWVKLLKEGEAR